MKPTAPALDMPQHPCPTQTPPAARPSPMTAHAEQSAPPPDPARETRHSATPPARVRRNSAQSRRKMNSREAHGRVRTNSGSNNRTRRQCPPEIPTPDEKPLICCRKEPSRRRRRPATGIIHGKCASPCSPPAWSTRCCRRPARPPCGAPAARVRRGVATRADLLRADAHEHRLRRQAAPSSGIRRRLPGVRRRRRPVGVLRRPVRHQHPMWPGEAGDKALAARPTTPDQDVRALRVPRRRARPDDVGAYFPHRVTYHPTCHSLRMLGVGDRPPGCCARSGA